MDLKWFSSLWKSYSGNALQFFLYCLLWHSYQHTKMLYLNVIWKSSLDVTYPCTDYPSSLSSSCEYVLAKLLLLSVQLYPILPWTGTSQDLPLLTPFLTALPVTSMLPHPKGNLMSSSYLMCQHNLKEVELLYFSNACTHFFFIWCSPLPSPWLLLLILLAGFSSKANLFLNVNIST